MRFCDFLNINNSTYLEIQSDKRYVIAGVQNYGKGILNKREVYGRDLTMKKYQVIEENCLMWCKVDTKNGAFGVTRKEHIGSLASTNMCLAKIDIVKVLPDFLQALFTLEKFYNSITEKSTGTTNRQYLTPKQLLELIEIPELNIEEQKTFLKRFYSLKNGGLFQEIDQQQSYLQLLRQTILQEAVQGKLTKQDKNDEPASELLKRIKAEKKKLIKEGKLKKEKELLPISEDETPFELPKGWIWCRLGEIIDDLKYGTSQKCDYKKARHAVLRIPNLSKGAIDFDDLKFANLPKEEFDNLKLKTDDMLVIRSNGSENLVGRTAVFKGAGFDCAYAGYLVRLRFNLNLIHVDYIHQVLESKFLRNLIEFPLRTTSGVKNINSTELSNLLMPLPPLSEQQCIVAKVEQLHQQLNQLETQVQQSREYAQQLLQAVLKEAFETNSKNHKESEELSLAAEE